MKLSIVTVCFNCEATVERTLESLVEQKRVEFEYIVIDGKSTDNTCKIIYSYSEKIKNMKLISEPDDGIYDAMNKGVKNSTGEYIYFLNAGDVFASENVLAAFIEATKTGRDLYFGNSIKDNFVERYPRKISDFYLIFREKMICHQALIAKRIILCQFPFDTTYRICADRDWLLKSIHSGSTYEYIKDLSVCIYDVGGVSTNYEKYNKESLMIARRYRGVLAVLFIKIKRNIGKMAGNKW